MEYKIWSNLIDTEGNKYLVTGYQCVRDTSGSYCMMPVLSPVRPEHAAFVDMDMSKYKQKEE